MNIIWFRKDLRIEDNPALSAALVASDSDAGSLKAIYIASPNQWQQHHGSAIQADFIERHLNLLAKKLAHLGIEFEILQAPSFKQTLPLLQHYCQQHQVTRLFANSELEINEVKRDQQMINHGVPLVLFESDVILPKGTVVNLQGEMFKVFTPFKKAWLKNLICFGFECASLGYPKYSSITSQDDISLPYDKKDSTKWPLVDDYVKGAFEPFLQDKVALYQQHRDMPAIKGTSGLSPYLAIGALSPKTILQKLLHHYPPLLDSPQHPAFSWLNEIIWREFYRHLMYHYPSLSCDTNFKPQYDQLMWVNNPQAFKHWCNGTTGYPIVDAAMRQLLDIGWMHNRLRMIVASFLTKHLLIDWRWGMRYFSEHLIDNDLAANNGGWQWSAGTGCDAQPYFRIFNPISQSKKFDANGEFIRRYLPQLTHVPDKHIHFPHDYLNQDLLTQHQYWPAIVDHQQARQQALDFYQNRDRKSA